MSHLNKRIDPNKKKRRRLNVSLFGNCKHFYNQYNNDYLLNNDVIMIRLLMKSSSINTIPARVLSISE
jgi:hypothetical protein